MVRMARTRRLDMRMHRSMGVSSEDVAVRIAVYGFIVRMHRPRAAVERHLMLAADAMLQRPRKHALDRQCYRENPDQEKAGKFMHGGKYRGLEQEPLSRSNSRFG